MGRKFCGFGLGAIQVGLFLKEAQESGAFDRLTVVEVNADLVGRVRAAGGALGLNIASPGGIRAVTVEGVEALHPEKDRELVLSRLAEADELSTAIPAVDFYGKGGEASIAALLAAARRRAGNRPQILYTAENNNHAAEILEEELGWQGLAATGTLQILNTVVGKMSGLLGAAEMARLGLRPFLPGGDRAFLVEEFNRILISRVRLPGFARGIRVFEEKEDLLPFEEAKLFGHNCMHAWLAYAGLAAGLASMDAVGKDAGLMERARRAFLEESGFGLVRKYQQAGLRDALFTPEGFTAYAHDLLGRMVNPHLSDALERVGRDPRRKLAPADRLCGAALLCLEAGKDPLLLVEGIEKGLRFLARTEGEQEPSDGAGYRALLRRVWEREPEGPLENRLFALLGG